jgi:hypothetical protein
LNSIVNHLPPGGNRILQGLEFRPMAKDSEQRLKARIELAIAAATLAIAILAYVKPADPQHPPHFDFLSKVISVPLWLAVTLVVGVVTATAAIVRLRLASYTMGQSNSIGSAPPIVPSRPAQREPERSIPSFLDVPHEPQLPSPSAMLTASSADDIAVEIKNHEQLTTRGLVISVTNNRLSTIHKLTIRVQSAQSFDARHQAFRDGIGFSPLAMTRPNVVLPSCSDKQLWLVRKEANNDHLLAGDNNMHPMIWPDNDKSRDQKWRMVVSVAAETWPTGPPLLMLKLDFTVEWKRDQNVFSVQQN